MTRGLGMTGVGLVCALTASGAGMPPQPGGVTPVPPDAVTRPSPHPLAPLPAPPTGVPPLPVPPPSFTPVIPQPLEFKQPLPPAPPEPEITEPVAAVYRFKGKYLGGVGGRALVYVGTRDGKAEVQSRPLADAIPRADEAAKDEVKRVEVPAGEATYHAGKVFVVAPREVVAVNGGCRVDWRFALPGNETDSERLVGVGPACDRVGRVDRLNVMSRAGNAFAKTNRVYVLDIRTGNQLAFALLETQQDESAAFFVSAHHAVFMANGERVHQYNIARHAMDWSAYVHTTGDFRTPCLSCVFTATAAGVGAVHREGFAVLVPDSKLTAPPTLVRGSRPRVLLPTRAANGTFALSLFGFNLIDKERVWELALKGEVSAAPVVRGASVYFVAGNIVYRVNATDGAVCWKHTLALTSGETLTDLAFVEGELRASGAGVMVRIAERAEPQPPLPAGPFAPVPPAPGVPPNGGHR